MAQLLVIGLDGATWGLLDRYVEAGRMPSLRELVGRGARGILRSTVPWLTPPAWASFITGANPGRHGVYYFRSFAAGSYVAPGLASAGTIRSPRWWEHLNEHGIRCGVMNLPLTYPPTPVDGFLVGGMFTPPDAAPRAWPAAAEAIAARQAIDVAWRPRVRSAGAAYAAEALAYIRAVVAAERERTDTVLRLVAALPVDVLAVVYYLPDRLQHFFWDLLAADDDGPLGRACRDAYSVLDGEIGRLVAAVLAPGGHVGLMSDHGFGPTARQRFHIARWLVGHGYLRTRPLWRLRRAVHANLPRSIRRRTPGGLDPKSWVIDWGLTRVWPEPLEYGVVGLRINRRGLYPLGCVAERELGDLVAALRAELAQVRDAAGRPVVTAIFRREELYRGACVEEAPDLMLILDPDCDADPNIKHDLAGRAWTSPVVPARSGAHRPEGIYLWAGPRIVPASAAPEFPIESMASTLIALAGAPLPATADGRVMSELLRGGAPPPAAPRPPPAAAGPGLGPVPAAPYSPVQERELEQRLRDLGYLG